MTENGYILSGQSYKQNKLSRETWLVSVRQINATHKISLKFKSLKIYMYGICGLGIKALDNLKFVCHMF